MYKIIGADGKEYSSVSLEQLQRWVGEGRVNAQTRVQQEGEPEWRTAAELPELSAFFAAAAPEPAVISKAAEEEQKKGLAITSFVLGLVSFVGCLTVLTGIPAIICGHLARTRVRRLPNEYGGGGFAIAGLVLGYLSIAFFVCLLAVFLPAFAKARAAAQSVACANNLRQVGLAFRSWDLNHNDQFPFNVGTNAGGTLEWCAVGRNGFDQQAVRHFQVMSNELCSPRILICPSDCSKRAAPDFHSLQSSNISYQLCTGPAITESNATEVLAVCPIHGHALRCDGTVQQRRRPGIGLPRLNGDL